MHFRPQGSLGIGTQHSSPSTQLLFSSWSGWLGLLFLGNNGWGFNRPLFGQHRLLVTHLQKQRHGVWTQVQWFKIPMRLSVKACEAVSLNSRWSWQTCSLWFSGKGSWKLSQWLKPPRQRRDCGLNLTAETWYWQSCCLGFWLRDKPHPEYIRNMWLITLTNFSYWIYSPMSCWCGGVVTYSFLCLAFWCLYPSRHFITEVSSAEGGKMAVNSQEPLNQEIACPAPMLKTLTYPTRLNTNLTHQFKTNSNLKTESLGRQFKKSLLGLER